jgi:hypothetical protein
MLALNCVPDQATGALNESELVREAAFQQDTDAKWPVTSAIAINDTYSAMRSASAGWP